MSSEEIVGHKTFSTGDPLQPFRHEPLTRAEADKILEECEAQRKARETLMPTEEVAVRMMCDAFHRLKELGWRDACYAPSDTPMKLVEPGSSGIHDGHAAGEWPHKSFWIEAQGDMWPSRPCLFKCESTVASGKQGD